MPHSKHTLIKQKISTYLDEVLHRAEQEGKIDYFKLEANNHNGTLQMDILFREREKAY